MKIHAILCAYSTDFSIKRALDSLLQLQPHIRDLTILSTGTTEALLTYDNRYWGKRNLSARCLKASEFKIVLASNEYTDSDVHMFLFNHDYLTLSNSNFPIDMLASYSLVANPYKVANQLCSRPFLIKSQTLQERLGNLSCLLGIDPEAAITALMHKFYEHEMKTLDYPVVKQTQLSNDRHRIEYLRALAQPLQPTPIGTNCNVPSVAVILSNYNMGNYIHVALSLLDSQSVPFDEIHLIDDGSIDNSLSIMRNWASHQERASVIESSGNLGKARALNAVLPHVTSEFVLELDADDWLDPHALESIYNHMTTFPDDANLLYGNFRTWRIDHHGNYRGNGIHTGYQAETVHSVLSYPLPLGPRIYRTEALKKIGGFAVPAFAEGRLYEDVLTITRLLEIGRIQYCDFTVYNTVAHSNSITRQNRAMWRGFIDTEFNQVH